MNDAEQKGAVYCATNPTMQDLVKIGLVENGDVATLQARVKNRINALYSGNTSMPVPFKLHYAVAVDDPSAIEEMLHDTFQHARANPKREFFRINPEQVVAAMNLTGGDEVTISDAPNDDPDAEVTQVDIIALERAQETENQRQSSFQFHKIDIPVGAELTFLNDQSITAVVHNEKNKIRFRENVTTTSAAAKIVHEQQGRYSNVSGTLYWEYNGETIYDRRKRMEAEEAKKLDLDE